MRWDSTRYTTLADFNAATGQEKNGLNADPGFFDAGHEIYTLDPGSDLVDAGTLIPGINDGYSGLGPDMGAFEYDSGNTAPVAVNDAADTEVDTPVTIHVTANDGDADGDTLAVENFSAASAHGGTVAAQDPNHLIYTPAAGFVGSDTFTYTATDGQAASNAAVVTITVAAAGSNGDAGDSGGSGSGGCFIGALRQHPFK